MNDSSDNPWEAPAETVSSRQESLFRNVDASAFSGSIRGVLRGLRQCPRLALPSLSLFVAHASPVLVFWAASLGSGSVGLSIFAHVWFVMPFLVTAVDLWAAQWWLHYFRKGELPSGRARWPRLRALRLAIPIGVITLPWSFLAFMAFAEVSSQDLELPRTTLIVFYAVVRGLHFFHAALYADRPRGSFGQYFKAFAALSSSPLRIVALGLLFVVPIVVMDQFGRIPAVRVLSVILCLPGALIVPGIAAYAFDRMVRPGRIGTEPALKQSEG